MHEELYDERLAGLLVNRFRADVIIVTRYLPGELGVAATDDQIAVKSTAIAGKKEAPLSRTTW